MTASPSQGVSLLLNFPLSQVRPNLLLEQLLSQVLLLLLFLEFGISFMEATK